MDVPNAPIGNVVGGAEQRGAELIWVASSFTRGFTCFAPPASTEHECESTWRSLGVSDSDAIELRAINCRLPSAKVYEDFPHREQLTGQ